MISTKDIKNFIGTPRFWAALAGFVAGVLIGMFIAAPLVFALVALAALAAAAWWIFKIASGGDSNFDE